MIQVKRYKILGFVSSKKGGIDKKGPQEKEEGRKITMKGKEGIT